MHQLRLDDVSPPLVPKLSVVNAPRRQIDEDKYWLV
jgi:hypothetical protein